MIERISDRNGPALVIALGFGQTTVEVSLLVSAVGLVSVAQPRLAATGNVPVQLPCTLVTVRASTTPLIPGRGQGDGQANAILELVVGNHNGLVAFDAHAFPASSRNGDREGDGGEELGEEHGLIAINVKKLYINTLGCERCLFVQGKNVPGICDS